MGGCARVALRTHSAGPRDEVDRAVGSGRSCKTLVGGQQRRVDRRRPGFDDAIGSKVLAGANFEQRFGGNGLHRDLANAFLGNQPRRTRSQRIHHLGGLLRRSLTWKEFWSVLTDTGLVTASVCFLIIAAQMYSRMLALSGAPGEFGNFVATADIGFWGVVIAYVALVIVMGTILDSSSIMLILVPLMLPVIQPMNIDLIWFGIVMVMVVARGRPTD